MRVGQASPRPTGVFHFWVSSLGQLEGGVNPTTLLSRLGPRHWGQSAAPAARTPVPRATVARSINRLLILHLHSNTGARPGSGSVQRAEHPDESSQPPYWRSSVARP